MLNQSSEWSLEQWLYGIEHRVDQEVQLGLARIREVAHRMNLLTPKSKVITVTGTNGKGSTVSALETIYHCAGYKVGSYTSPHLIRFNERIKVNTAPVSDEAICSAFSSIELARGTTVLTYFEMATLAALWHFQNLELDIVILEVGIGGRLDATNIINSDVSIITTVNFDHQEYLGSTLEAIGFEKAGILRENKPFIYADTNPPASILEMAKTLNSPSYLLENDFNLEDHGERWQLTGAGSTFELDKPLIQLKSASAAIMACCLLHQDLPIQAEHINKAMKLIFLPGRLQLLPGEVDILFDVSHNAQSVGLLANSLKNRNKSKIHAVFSALKDKDLLSLILPLKDCVSRWYPAQLDNKRASSASLLLSKFDEAEIKIDVCYTSPIIAFKEALNQAEAGDLIVIYGSFYTVSQVMAFQYNLLKQEI